MQKYSSFGLIKNMPNLPSTRSEAIIQNSKWYFTGIPCARGHISNRFTKQGICMLCSRENAMKDYQHTTDRRRSYSDLEGFIKASNSIHNNKYSYSSAVYLGAHTKLSISCPTHGLFMQSPTNHVSGQGCPQCSNDITALRCVGNTIDLIKNAQKIWGETYDYRLVSYVKAHKKVTITCRTHGVFKQTPTNHLTGKSGCPRCNHMKSSQEEEVATYLSIFAQVLRRDRSLLAPKELDIVLPDLKIAVEYCGMYWHSHDNQAAEKQDKHKHYQKYKACSDLGYRLITVYETEWLNNKPAIKRLLRNAIGKSKGSVMARKCALKKVSNAEARAFYNKYHPQGGAGSGEHYGLYWKDKLVACMRFVFGANDRGAGASARAWTLGRYATRVNVVGGASKLFQAFIREFNPPEVKSFSDNRYFTGGMYTQLGFVLETDVAPDYQVWSSKLGLRPKPHYQRRNLPKRLLEHGCMETFDPDPDVDPRTEADITYLMGARRIYDCGKKRWVWKNNCL